MRDEEASLGSSPPQKHGSSMGELSQEGIDTSLVIPTACLSVMLFIINTVFK